MELLSTDDWIQHIHSEESLKFVIKVYRDELGVEIFDKEFLLQKGVLFLSLYFFMDKLIKDLKIYDGINSKEIKNTLIQLINIFHSKLTKREKNNPANASFISNLRNSLDTNYNLGELCYLQDCIVKSLAKNAGINPYRASEYLPNA